MESPTLSPTLTPMQIHHTVTAMSRYGGGFCRALAKAWFVADPDNRLKIQTTFSELMAQFGPTSAFYDEMDN